MSKRIVGIKFRESGSVYYFLATPFVINEDDRVIVKTEEGIGLGTVVITRDNLPEGLEENDLKPVFRLANEEDLQIVEENQELSGEAFKFCKACIKKRELPMKLVDVEVYFDRSKMIFYFTAPTRIDFRELVKDLVRQYRTRIELRQIGVRHETQMLGGVGNCGQVCCCRRFLRKFEPVTIKMAKDQNLFLNPAKISGVCGRLLCCLAFEQDHYMEFQKKLPRMGKRYPTTEGLLRVIRANIFRDTITVLNEEGQELEIKMDDWQQMVRLEEGR